MPLVYIMPAKVAGLKLSIICNMAWRIPSIPCNAVFRRQDTHVYSLKNILCQLQTHRAPTEQQQQQHTGRAEQSSRIFPASPMLFKFRFMMLSCAVLKMLLRFLREGICTTDIDLSVSMIFNASKGRAVIETVE